MSPAAAKCFIVPDSRPWQGSETSRAQTLCLADELDSKARLDAEIARLQAEIGRLEMQQHQGYTYTPYNQPSYVPLGPAF